MPSGGYIGDKAREAVDAALVGVRSPASLLCALIQAASDRLAEHAGHGAAAAELGQRSRYHYQQTNRRSRPGLGALR